MHDPVVSILIPNYNNGRQSARDGRRDFIDDLLRSLVETLADDPTPLEILVADDGSTDDSLATCRAWSERDWPSGPRAGTPVLRLIELAHCGVLSVVANHLTEEARGSICCRLDGDIVVHTPRWAERLVEIFDAGPPRLGMVGPKQLGVDGSVHAAGSWILHPRGHHHLYQAARRTAVRRSIEVDHVMGCFYCHRREIWSALGGYDESFLRGQTVDFGLRARLEGWIAWSVPDIEFTHYHAERVKRPTGADSDAGVDRSLQRFTDKWGFNRLAPDLDDVAARYRGTPLLWNADVFGPTTPWPPRASGPIDLAESEWTRFAHDTSYQGAVQQRLAVIAAAMEQSRATPRVLQIASRAGLLLHLLAMQGVDCVGIEGDPYQHALARSVTGRETYPGPAPTLRLWDDPARWPIDDDAIDVVLLLDVLDTHPNPVRLMREAHRVLRADGHLAVVVRERHGPMDPGTPGTHPYRGRELLTQLQGTGLFQPMDGPLPVPEGQVARLARRLHVDPARTYPPLDGVVEVGAGASVAMV